MPVQDAGAGGPGTRDRAGSHVQIGSVLERRPFLHAAAGYAAVILFLCHRTFLGEVLSPAANLWAQPPFRSQLREDFSQHLNGMQADVWREFEPAHRYQYRSMRGGRLPLWNPYIFCGAPFHASGQAAMLSPFHWLYFAADPAMVAGLAAALKWWVAALGTFGLARHLGMSWTGSFVAGLCWMLCAFNVRWLQWNHAAAAAWLPVILWSSDRLLDGVTIRRVALAGLAAAALQLSGHPQTQFHAGMLAGLFVLVRVVSRTDSARRKLGRLGACLLAQCLGLAAAAVWLWPFAESLCGSADWSLGTHRADRALPLESLLGWVAPDHWGRPRAERFYQGPLNYNEAGMYIGVVPLGLALAALLRLRSWQADPRTPGGAIVPVCGVWLVVCAMLVFGPPGLADLWERLPLLSKANNLRMVMGLQFAGALLAGVGWSELERTGSGRRSARFLLCALAVALVSGYVLFGPPPVGLYPHRDGLATLWSDPQTPSPIEHRSLRTLVGFAIAVAAVLGGVWRAGRGALLFSLILVDLLWVATGFNPWVPRRVALPAVSESIRMIQAAIGNDRMVATGEILVANLSMDFGLRDVRGYEFPMDLRLHRVLERLKWDPLNPLLPGHQADPCVMPMVQSFCDKASVRFLYSMRPRAQGAGSLAVCPVHGESVPDRWPVAYRSESGSEVVFENPTAYPRAFIARQAEMVGSDRALDALLDVAHDMRELSFVERPVAESARGKLELKAEVAIVRDEPESMELRVRASRPALLVVNDSFDPGWVIRVDGARADPLRANYLFRGVVVPEGEHEVSWTYEPRSLRRAAALSCVALLGLAIGAMVSERRLRGSAAPERPV